MQGKNTAGERIAQARRYRKLSQKQLAELISVESNTISMYENDARRPSVGTLIRLARALRVSTDYILLGEEVRYIDVSGLESREKNVLNELADILRCKNKKSLKV